MQSPLIEWLFNSKILKNQNLLMIFEKKIMAKTLTNFYQKCTFNKYYQNTIKNYIYSLDDFWV